MEKNDEVISVLARIRDRRTMKRLFGEIFTPRERKDIALRWQLMKMLAEGVSQRRVAEKLGISLCKITRGARVLRKRGSTSRALLGTNRHGRARTAQRSRKRNGHAFRT
ncbi:MAG: transcriptional regulator [Chitinivibrionales bacterium]|nr:transcriptional regulator [Chitinivibrionales bacterium]MBD3396695.1 transcriptional regulator [Chitinivibrionales bacterium]